EIAEAGELDAITGLQGDADLFEESLDHVLGFALIESELLEQQVGKFGFGERHRGPRSPYWRSAPPNRSWITRSNETTAASISASVKVRAVSCISTRIARLFLPTPIPGPRYTSNSARRSTEAGLAAE